MTKPDSLLTAILSDPLDRGVLTWNQQTASFDNLAAGRSYALWDGIPAFAELGKPRYDGVSSWYDEAMQESGERGDLARSAFSLLSELLGPGEGTIVDIGCGTGLSAAYLRQLGYQPVGIDLSLDMLHHAQRRLPVAQGNASRLPLANQCVAQSFSTFTSTDWDDFPAALNEISRILQPGGRYINLGVHPCFYGSYAEPYENGEVRQLPGYNTAHFRSPQEHHSAVRSRVGAWHRPLATLLNGFIEAGLQITRVVEGGASALPNLLAICAVKPEK
jgi:SAM-dependent methyltransferase